jgi:predicted transcriptional regulator
VIITAEIADLLFSSSPSSYTTPTMPFTLYEDAHKIVPPSKKTFILLLAFTP